MTGYALDFDSISHAVVSGPFLIAFFACMFAGLLSFASPCVIPLVPGYITYLASLVSMRETVHSPQDPTQTNPAVSAESSDDSSDSAHDNSGQSSAVVSRIDADVPRSRVLLSALFFVLGYSIVFILGSASIFGLIDGLTVHRELIQRIGGAITIIMAAIFLGFFPQFQNVVRLDIPKVFGPAGGLLLGGVFGLSWTPCLGPALSGIVSVLAGTQGLTVTRGIILMFAYCCGLGLPFLGAAYGSHYALVTIGWLRRHIKILHIISGVLLFIVGIALITGLWNVFILQLRDGFIGNWQVPL